MSKRIITINYDQVDLNHKGIYKITNMINKHFYIGSATRTFKERLKEHCRYYEQYINKEKDRIMNPVLWKAFTKYGISNFQFEIIEILDSRKYKEILEREEYYIQTLHPQYNICQYPSCGGKPNLGRKLSNEWKENIRQKSLQYKHSPEILSKVTENNKKNAVQLHFEHQDTCKELDFKSWVEAQNYFGLKSTASIKTAYKNGKLWRRWKVTQLSTQKKQISVNVDGEEHVFQSFNECDRYFNMWRGYTSTLIHKIGNNLFLDKYKYKLI